MDRNPSPKPVVRHSTAAKDADKFQTLLTHFTKQAIDVVRKKMMNGEFKDWHEIDEKGERLLKYRRELAACIREGMLERKDKEIEIVVLAVIVWFQRMGMDEQRRILEEWGI